MKTFDWQEYLASNPDLTEAGIDNELDAMRHFLNHGISEQRYYGDAFLSYKTTKIAKPNNIKDDVSIVVGCKNREKMLDVSIRSWLYYPEIKEIIITDWSSDNPINYLEKIDPRIKVIRVDGQQYYNASTPVNIAIKKATSPIIMKLDTDYIINPYGNFYDLISINHNEFITGNHEDTIIDNDLNFVKGMNGYLCVYKEHIESVGYYDENIENYGVEDCDMFSRLCQLGLRRKTLQFNPCNISIYHNPHNGYHRTKNFKEKDWVYNSKKYGDIHVAEKLEKGPDFIIAGFQKSGTSALADNLCTNFPEHIYMPRKNKNKITTYELDFFSKWQNLSPEWYESLFLADHDNRLCGDKSPNYCINSDYSSIKIHRLLPNAKLIFSLRNPVTRAYSAYNHFTQMLPKSKHWYWDSEKNFLENIFNEETKSYNHKCSFLKNSLYSEHIGNYLKYFDRSQMLFIVQERMWSEETSDSEWDKVISFLDLPSKKINNKVIHKRKYEKPMCDKSKELLQEYFKEHNDKLFELLGYRIEEWDKKI